jgi:hypothetical protein
MGRSTRASAPVAEESRIPPAGEDTSPEDLADASAPPVASEPARPDSWVRVRPDGHLSHGLRVALCPGLEGGTLWVAPGAEVRVNDETARYLLDQHASELDLRAVE